MLKRLSMTFDDFKTNISEIKKEILQRDDIIDFDNGMMIIYPENLNKYLERYSCKNADDLQDTLWGSYGVFVKIVD